MRRVVLSFMAALVGGCGGEFILTAPDAVGLPGEPAPVVVRLQRREFWFHAPPVGDAAITFRRDDGPVLAARTDSFGYAAIGVELPARPGRYQLRLHHQDSQADTVSGTAAMYVLAPNVPIAAVDLDSLPSGYRAAAEAAAALMRIRKRAQLIYLTQRHAGAPARAHQLLSEGGYPDSAVVAYTASESRWRKRRPGALDALRQRLPGLRWGVAGDDDPAEAFADAGLVVLGVADRSAREASNFFFADWALLRLPADGSGD